MKMRHVFIIALTAILSACSTPIAVITSNPSKFKDKEVKIKGRVISTIKLEDLSIFTIKQNGSKINVVTNDFLPVINDFVTVKGVVDNKFYYQRDTLLVVKETVKAKEKTNFNKAVN